MDWAEHEPLLKSIVWRVSQKYSFYDSEELYSEALLAYAQALELYEPYFGSIEKWIHFRVWKTVLEIVRTRARRLNITGRIHSDPTQIYSKPNSLLSLVKDLSKDSQQALCLLFELDTSQRALNKSLIKLKWRTSIKRRLGWENGKINSCFSEIEAAIN